VLLGSALLGSCSQSCGFPASQLRGMWSWMLPMVATVAPCCQLQHYVATHGLSLKQQEHPPSTWTRMPAVLTNTCNKPSPHMFTTECSAVLLSWQEAGHPQEACGCSLSLTGQKAKCLTQRLRISKP
jgi:hypothetical protein